MDIIVTLIIGSVIGWLGSLVMKTDAHMGILGNIVVGIVDSFPGFWIAGLVGLGASSQILRWVIAVAGAAILIWILKLLNMFK